MRRLWAGILAAGLTLFAASASWANGCETDEPTGVSLAELETTHATALSQTDAGILLGDAKRLHDAAALSQTDARILLGDAKLFHDLGRDESRVLALLLLHRILDGEFPEAAKADALVLATEVRGRLTNSHFKGFYKCQELKALDQYIEAHGEGYRFAELWGSYLYEPSQFLDEYLAGLSKEEAIRARFGAYRAIDPCDPYQYDNSCYGPFFSKLAEEAAGTPVEEAAIGYAFEANLNLAVCPYASEKERKLGEETARRWAGRLGESAAKSLADYEKGQFKPSEGSLMCRRFNDN